MQSLLHTTTDISTIIPEITTNNITANTTTNTIDDIFEEETTSQLFESSISTTPELTTTTQTTTSDPSQIIVYITDTGTKYHTSNCKYLKQSSTAITLQESIKRGYTPCSKYNPPELENTNL